MATDGDTCSAVARSRKVEWGVECLQYENSCGNPLRKPQATLRIGELLNLAARRTSGWCR